MDPRDVQAFVKRDWVAVRAAKEAYWAREFAAKGSAATFAASEALWRHMRLIRPDWPTDEERQEDLAHHVALKALIDRAAGALRNVSGR
jgi:hypothetical protein